MHLVDWGTSNRMSRIFPDGKTVMLAVDHGYFGYTKGLEDLRAVVEPLLPYADALMIPPGSLRTIDPQYGTPIVLRASGCVSSKPVYRFKGAKYPEPDTMANERLIVTAEDAARLNASAVAVSIYLESLYQTQTLDNLATMAREAGMYGIPRLGVTAVGPDLEKRLEDSPENTEYFMRVCRITAEHGASFVKTYYCKDFERVIRACPVPIVVAGGKRSEEDPEKSALRMAYRAMQEGASGVDFGRNVWQSPYPVPMLRTLRAIVHDSKTDVEAIELFEELKHAA